MPPSLRGAKREHESYINMTALIYRSYTKWSHCTEMVAFEKSAILVSSYSIISIISTGLIVAKGEIFEIVRYF